MGVRERLLSIRLLERQARNPNLAKQLILKAQMAEKPTPNSLIQRK